MKTGKRFSLAAMVLLATFGAVFGQIASGTLPIGGDHANPILDEVLMEHSLFVNNEFTGSAGMVTPNAGNVGINRLLVMAGFRVSSTGITRLRDYRSGTVAIANNGNTPPSPSVFHYEGTRPAFGNLAGGWGVPPTTHLASAAPADQTTPLYPVRPRMPNLSISHPGTSNGNISVGSVEPYNPGRYGSIDLPAGESIYLNAGVYYFTSITMRQNTRIFINPVGGSYVTRIYVSGNVQLGTATGQSNIWIVPTGFVGGTTVDNFDQRSLGQIMLLVSGNAHLERETGVAPNRANTNRIVGSVIVSGEVQIANSDFIIYGQLICNRLVASGTFNGAQGIVFIPPDVRDVSDITITPPDMTFPRHQLCDSQVRDTVIRVTLPSALTCATGSVTINLSWSIPPASIVGGLNIGPNGTDVRMQTSGTLTFTSANTSQNRTATIPLGIVNDLNYRNGSFDILFGTPAVSGNCDVTYEMNSPGQVTMRIRMVGDEQSNPARPSFNINTDLPTYRSDGNLTALRGQRGILEHPSAVGQGVRVPDVQILGTTGVMVPSGVQHEIVSVSVGNINWFQAFQDGTNRRIRTTSAYAADFENSNHRQITIGVRAVNSGNLECFRDSPVETFTINVLPWNDNQMTLVNNVQNITVNEGAPVTFDGMLLNGSNIVSGDLDQHMGDNIHKVVANTGGARVSRTGNQITYTASGTYTFVNNQTTETFTYTIRDTANYGYPTAYFDMLVTVNVTINAVAAAIPVPVPHTITLCENQSATIEIGDLTIADADVNRGLTVVHRFLAGSVSNSNTTLGNRASIVNGRIVYDLTGVAPNVEVFDDVITYRIAKGEGAAMVQSEPATITVRIRPVNDNPVQVAGVREYTFAQAVSKEGNIILDEPSDLITGLRPIELDLGGTSVHTVRNPSDNYRIERVVGDVRTVVPNALVLSASGSFVFNHPTVPTPVGVYEFTYTLDDHFIPITHADGYDCVNPDQFSNPGIIRIVITPSNVNSPTAQSFAENIIENEVRIIDVASRIDDHDLIENIGEVLTVELINTNLTTRGRARLDGPTVGDKRNTRIIYEHAVIGGREEFDITLEHPFVDVIHYRVKDNSGNDNHFADGIITVRIEPTNDNRPKAATYDVDTIFKSIPLFVYPIEQDSTYDIDRNEDGSLITDAIPLRIREIVGRSDDNIDVQIIRRDAPLPDYLIVTVPLNANYAYAWIDYTVSDSGSGTPRGHDGISEKGKINFLTVADFPAYPIGGVHEITVNEGQTWRSDFSVFGSATPFEIDGVQYSADRARLLTNATHGTVTLDSLTGMFTYTHYGNEETISDNFEFVLRNAEINAEFAPRQLAGRVNITIRPRNNNAPVIHWHLDPVSLLKNRDFTVTVIVSDDGARNGARITDFDLGTPPTRGTLIIGELGVNGEYFAGGNRGIIGEPILSTTEFGTVSATVSADRKSIIVTHTGNVPFGNVLEAKIVISIIDTILYNQNYDPTLDSGHINVRHIARPEYQQNGFDTIFVRILPSNDREPIQTGPAIFYVDENGSVSGNLNVPTIVMDPDGFPLTFTPLSFNEYGNTRVTVNANGSFTYTHDGIRREEFTDTFKVVVSDGEHQITIDVILRIRPKNDEKPFVIDRNYRRLYEIYSDSVLRIDSANGIIPWIGDEDIYPSFDGNWNYTTYLKDSFTVEVAVSNPRFVVNSNGSFTYTPVNGILRDSVAVIVKDFAPETFDNEEGPGSDRIWIVVVINELPRAIDDVLPPLGEGRTTSVNLIANDINPEDRWILTATNIIDGVQAVVIVDEARYGTFTLINNVFTYTNDPRKLTGTQTSYTETLRYVMQGLATDGKIVFDTAEITITITANPPTADGSRAFYTDENADGRVDRITIPFDREINRAATNFEVRFGGMTTSNVTSQYARNEDGSENRNIVILSGFNAPEDTTGGIMGITIEYTNFGTSQTISNVADRAAPVVTSAVFTRVPGGRDTLVLTMSEEDSRIFIGGGNLPFYFVRNGGSFPQDSFNVSFERLLHNENEYKFVINLGDSARIFEDDSIFVNWELNNESIVQDLFENRQNNPANKRVPIKTQIETQILSAVYFETEKRNGRDGFIDSIRIDVGTIITQSDAERIAEALSLSPTRKFIINTVTLNETRTGFNLSVTEERRTANQPIRHYTPNTGLFADDYVSVNASLVLNNALTINPSSVKATDSVAPVILYAEYVLGEGARNNHLNVVFSEPVTATNANPYKFLQRSTDYEYDMIFRGIGVHTSPEPHILRYEVDSTGVSFPLSGDSIWIVLGGVVRDTGNIQNNTTVRAPLVVVGEYPSDFELFVVPQPLRLMQVGNRQEPVEFCEDFMNFYNIPRNLNKGVAVVLDAKGPIVPEKQRGTVKIIDQTGNAVSDEIEMTFRVTERGTVSGVAVWNGKNRAGRTVGAASYLALIEIEVNFDDREGTEPRSYRRIIVVSSGH